MTVENSNKEIKKLVKSTEKDPLMKRRALTNFKNPGHEIFNNDELVQLNIQSSN